MTTAVPDWLRVLAETGLPLRQKPATLEFHNDSSSDERDLISWVDLGKLELEVGALDRTPARGHRWLLIGWNEHYSIIRGRVFAWGLDGQEGGFEGRENFSSIREFANYLVDRIDTPAPASERIDWLHLDRKKQAHLINPLTQRTANQVVTLVANRTIDGSPIFAVTWPKLRTLRLQNGNSELARRIPEISAPLLSSVDLTRSGLTEIPPFCLSRFPHLRKLSLQNNQITDECAAPAHASETDLGAFVEIDLQDNPCDAEHWRKTHHALFTRRVERESVRERKPVFDARRAAEELTSELLRLGWIAFTPEGQGPFVQRFASGLRTNSARTSIGDWLASLDGVEDIYATDDQITALFGAYLDG